jgi:MoxR-like ATPase
VRGAIDVVRLAVSLARLRETEPTEWHLGLDAALVGLSGRIGLHESSGRSAEAVIEELYRAVFGDPPSSDGDSGDGGDPPGEA